LGFTINGDNIQPPVCVILYSNIKSKYSFSTDAQKKVENYNAFHELGHGFRIISDNPSTPPHSGNNTDVCIMTTLNTTNVYEIDKEKLDHPVFCDGHIDFIKKQTWFLQGGN
jgi:hypothetical protein